MINFFPSQPNTTWLFQYSKFAYPLPLLAVGLGKSSKTPFFLSKHAQNLSAKRRLIAKSSLILLLILD